MSLEKQMVLAVRAAINSVGVVNFKKCSFFMSNDKESEQ